MNLGFLPLMSGLSCSPSVALMISIRSQIHELHYGIIEVAQRRRFVKELACNMCVPSHDGVRSPRERSWEWTEHLGGLQRKGLHKFANLHR